MATLGEKYTYTLENEKRSEHCANSVALNVEHCSAFFRL